MKLPLSWKDIVGSFGSGALTSTLKGLDSLPDDKVKETLVQLLRKAVEQGQVLGKVRQRRLVGLLRDAAAEVFLKDLQ